MQFTGSLADLNSALQNLSYVGDEDFNSNHHAEFLKVYMNDLGSSSEQALTSEAVIPISVNAINDAPTEEGDADDSSSTVSARSVV